MASELDPQVDRKWTLAEVDLNAAWRGNELAQREDWLQRLSETEIGELLGAAQQLTLDATALDTPDAINAVMPHLARRLRATQFSLENGSGATLIQGFPIDQLDQPVVERLFMAMMSVVGTPVSQTVQGDKLFHVRDEGFSKDDPRARGPSSRNRLTFHSDRCDVIAFLCIRDAKRGGENQVVSSVTLFETIRQQRPDLLRILMEPYWYKRHNVDPGNEHAFYQQPVFSIFEGRFASSLLRVLIERAYAESQTPEMTTAQREALDLVESMSAKPEMHHTFRQERGDILLLNNFVTLHRRTEFEDHEDPALRRHLLRLWLAMPNSRPLDPMYRASYGETAAGAIRGGMRTR